MAKLTQGLVTDNIYMHLFHQNFSVPGPRKELMRGAVMPSSTSPFHVRGGRAGVRRFKLLEVLYAAQGTSHAVRGQAFKLYRTSTLVILCDSPMHVATPTLAREPQLREREQCRRPECHTLSPGTLAWRPV